MKGGWVGFWNWKYCPDCNGEGYIIHYITENKSTEKEMKIQFYRKDNGTILTDTDDFYFVMNDEVYCDNGKSYESQEPTVQFEDFIMKCPELGWRIV